MARPFPFTPLTNDERIWLTAVAKKNMASEKFTDRELRSELHHQLSSKFIPDNISHSLLWNGAIHIKILGILAVDKNLSFLEKIDSVVHTIRKKILDEPAIEYMSIKEISQLSSLSENEVVMVIDRLDELGSFSSGGLTDKDNNRFIRVIGNDNIYPEYIKYDSAESLIYQRLLKIPFPEVEEEQRTNKKPEHPETFEDLLDNNPYFEKWQNQFNKRLISAKKIMSGKEFMMEELARIKNEYLKPDKTEVIFNVEVFNFSIYKKSAYDYLTQGFGYTKIEEFVNHARRHYFSRERFSGTYDPAGFRKTVIANITAGAGLVICEKYLNKQLKVKESLNNSFDTTFKNEEEKQLVLAAMEHFRITKNGQWSNTHAWRLRAFIEVVKNRLHLIHGVENLVKAFSDRIGRDHTRIANAAPGSAKFQKSINEWFDQHTDFSP